MSDSSQDNSQSAPRNKPRAKLSEAGLAAETQAPQNAALAAGSQPAGGEDAAVNTLRYRAGGDLATAGVEQQAEQLTNAPLGKLQRQQLLREIGRVQGNAHVQRLVGAVGGLPRRDESQQQTGMSSAASSSSAPGREEDREALLTDVPPAPQNSFAPAAGIPAASPQYTPPGQANGALTAGTPAEGSAAQLDPGSTASGAGTTNATSEAANGLLAPDTQQTGDEGQTEITAAAAPGETTTGMSAMAGGGAAGSGAAARAAATDGAARQNPAAAGATPAAKSDPARGAAQAAQAPRQNGAGPQAAAGAAAQERGDEAVATTSGGPGPAAQRGNIDYAARIEQFVQEARSGGQIGAAGAAQVDTRPSTVTGDTNAVTVQRYSPEPDRPINFAGFETTLDDQRQQIMQIAADNHAQVATAVASEQQRFEQNRNTAQDELNGSYDLALDALNRAHDECMESLQAHLAAEIARLNADASSQDGIHLANVAARQAEAIAAGEEKAAQAEAYGAQRSQEVSAGSEQQASAAIAIGAEKGAQHSASENAAEISQMASAAASQTAAEIRRAGTTLANVANQDMGALAAKFRQEAVEVASHIGDIGSQGVGSTAEQRQAAISGMLQVADDAARQLADAHAQSAGKLASTYSQAQSQLVQETAGVQSAIQQAGDDADLKIDENAGLAIATLESQAATIRSQFTGRLDAQAQAELDQATAAMATTAPQYAALMAGAIGEVTQAMAQQTTEANSKVNEFASGTQDAFAAATTQFATDAQAISGTAQAEISRLADEGIASVHDQVAFCGAMVGGASADAAAEWDSELAQATAELDGKLQRGEAEQATALTNLAREIDSQAAALENRGVLAAIGDALSAVGSFVASAVRAVATVMVAAVAAVVAVALAVVALAIVAVLVVAAIAVAVAAIVVAVAVVVVALIAAVAVAIVALVALAVTLVIAVVAALVIAALLIGLAVIVAIIIVVTALIPIVLKWFGIEVDFFGTDFNAARDLNVNRFDPEGEGSRTRVEDLDEGLDPDRPTIVIVHGWQNTEAEAWMMDIARAEHNAACAGQPEPCQGPQILIVGWGVGANTWLPYWTSHNIPAAGQELGRRLTQDYGLQPENVRFVGHSFGTYVANEAGRAMGGAAGITALDPADDLVGLNLFSRPDTDFNQNFGESEAIHTSPIAGNQTEHSDRDFYSDTEEGIIDNIADWMSGGHSIVDEGERHSEAQRVYVRYLEEKANRGPDYRLGDYMREQRDSENVTGYFEDGQERDISLTNVDRDGGPSEM